MSEGAAHATTKHRAGLIGGVVGMVAAGAAAGVAAGVTAQRVLTRRTRRGGIDPYADERFGRAPYDESLTVTTPDGVELYVEVVEPADGVELDADFAAAVAAVPAPDPTLIFVPGFCLDMGSFHFQRKELTRRGDWRAVYYDQPGHGRSGRLAAGEYELAGLAGALRAVLDETTPQGPVALIGHSMGGMAIMAFAERYPEVFAQRVVGVALIATSAGRLDGSATGLPEVISRLGRPMLPLVNGATRLTGGMIDRARRASTDLAWLLTRRYGFGGSQPSRALVSYVEHMNSHTSVDTVARYLRALYGHAGHSGLEALRDKPVLLICGDRDPITPLAHSEEIRAHLPSSALVVVPDSGHMVLLEHAEQVNAALFAFLRKTS